MQENKLGSVTSKSTAQYWDAISSNLAEGPPNEVWRRHSDTVNEELLARWLRKKGYDSLLKTDLFDECVGSGLCGFLAHYSDNLYGIDISGKCVAAAGDRYPALRSIHADIRALPYPVDFFDCIVSNSTLDHFSSLEDIETSLGELHRVMRPGAELIITLDNLQNPLIWLRSILPYRWLNRIGVLPYYIGATTTIRGLHKMLNDTGFDIRSSTAILHCPRVVAIPLSNWVKHWSPRSQQRWLRMLLAFELLGRTPLRYMSGHFIAVHATKIGLLSNAKEKMAYTGGLHNA